VKPYVRTWRIGFAEHENDPVNESEDEDCRQQRVVSGLPKHQVPSSAKALSPILAFVSDSKFKYLFLSWKLHKRCSEMSTLNQFCFEKEGLNIYSNIRPDSKTT
jgi:hypothetical protein